MSAKRFHLTPPLRSQIVAGIHAGGYPHVAAAAFAVPKEIFDDWLQRGVGAEAREPYVSFAKEVAQAQAKARLRAEMAVFEAEPKIWLIHGPGRETSASPGWTVSVKPAEGAVESRNVLLDPEMMSLFRTLMEVLRPYPEASAQVAQTLMGLGTAEANK
jgi:hypothetical protein